MQECVYIVHDTCPRHQRLDAVHQWHMGKHITKHRNSWSMQKTAVYMHEGKRTSLWISAKLWNRLRQAHTVTGPVGERLQAGTEDAQDARHYWDVLMILAPDINIQIYLLTYNRLVSEIYRRKHVVSRPFHCYLVFLFFCSFLFVWLLSFFDEYIAAI